MLVCLQPIYPSSPELRRAGVIRQRNLGAKFTSSVQFGFVWDAGVDASKLGSRRRLFADAEPANKRAERMVRCANFIGTAL